jgi:hypothetical protein
LKIKENTGNIKNTGKYRRGKNTGKITGNTGTLGAVQFPLLAADL